MLWKSQAHTWTLDKTSNIISFRLSSINTWSVSNERAWAELLCESSFRIFILLRFNYFLLFSTFFHSPSSHTYIRWAFPKKKRMKKPLLQLRIVFHLHNLNDDGENVNKKEIVFHCSSWQMKCTWFVAMNKKWIDVSHGNLDFFIGFHIQNHIYIQ